MTSRSLSELSTGLPSRFSAGWMRRSTPSIELVLPAAMNSILSPGVAADRGFIFQHSPSGASEPPGEVDTCFFFPWNLIYTHGDKKALPSHPLSIQQIWR